MSVTSYLYDPVRVVTSPGANALDPFSPPSGFSGSAGDYRLLLVSRYRVPGTGVASVHHGPCKGPSRWTQRHL